MARYGFAVFTSLGIVALSALAGCGAGSINGPVNVAAGQKTGDVSTVNGSITVGDGATIESAMTVNGGVSLGANVTAQSVKTVNGAVTVGDSSRVSGDVTIVNGSIELDKHSDVAGAIQSVNGSIRLTAAHVGGGISTANADIDIGEGSHLDGGIHINKASFSAGNDRHTPRVVIGPNTMVNGALHFEIPVKLYISESAQVSGPIEGATAEKFSGSAP
jgi:hypothetical protein